MIWTVVQADLLYTLMTLPLLFGVQRGPEGDQMRRWVQKSVDDVMRVVGTDGFMDKLLIAPSIPEDKDK